MADHNINGYDTVQIDGVDVSVGAEWEVERKYSGALLKLSIRGKASTSKKYYAAIHKVNESKGKERLTQYTLASIEDDSILVSGEFAVAKNIEKWCGGKLKRTTIFIKSIPRENSMAEPRFWITPIEVDGRISSGDSQLVNDRFGLNDVLSVFGITNDDFNVVIVENDGDAKIFVDEKCPDISAKMEVTVISESDLKDALSDKDCHYTRVYKPSKIKIKKVGSVAGVCTALTVGLFAFSYLSQKEGVDYFSQTEHLEKLDEKKDEYQDLSKGLKSKKNWDARTYRKATLSQFVNGLGANIYSPLEISLTLSEVNKILPIFSAEWRLAKLSFEGNRFYARYERIEGGSGTYYMLDKNISKINQLSENLSIAAFDLKDEGASRTYLLTPKSIPSRQPSIEKMLSRLQSEEKLDKRVIKNASSASRSIDSLEDIFKDYRNLTFQERWIYREISSLYNEVSDAEDRLYNSERTIQKAKKALRAFEPLELDDNLVLGNIMDFVTMLQLDNQYKWSFPQLERIYPDEKTLKSKNKKPSRNKKKKSSKKIDVYGPAIESYRVKITTQDTEEEGRIKSYGISDMIQLGLMLNKPFVNVDTVEYDKINEQWVFSIHFHRRTQEYSKRISNTDNKEDKS